MEIDLSGSEDSHQPAAHQHNPADHNAVANNHNNDKEDSYDDMSDGVGSDQEAKPNIGLHHLNDQRNDQAHKNVFAQEQVNADAKRLAAAPEEQ